MKLDQLRKIIREEVRAAVKEELQEVISEAVRIASTPQQATYKEVPKNQPKRWSTGKSASLDAMLESTRQEMSSQDYNNMINNPGPMKPNFASNIATGMGLTENSGPMPGIDISKLDFVSKAKSILDKSYEKDRQVR